MCCVHRLLTVMWCGPVEVRDKSWQGLGGNAFCLGVLGSIALRTSVM